MKTIILAFLLATALPVQAQQFGKSKTIKVHNNKTGEVIGTVTVSGATAYIRNKDNEHIYTVVRNPDGTMTSFDTNGNVIAPVKLPE
jgi:hypothetical protein